MAFFVIRFDLRNPPIAGTPMADRYRAALEMARWADDNGFVMCALSEHHGSPDGYLPSPLPFAAAVAAVTSRIGISVAAIIAPFHDPLRLAEDAAVVDLVSQGRLDLIIANGYVPSEFTMFGVDITTRAARTTRTIEVLRAAWTGEPFEHEGRTVCVTPAPHRPGGPPIALGGSTPAAARRAARLGVGFRPSIPDVWDDYRAEALRLGRDDPGDYPGGAASFLHVAEDVDAAWEAIGPYALHESNAYGAWAIEGGMGDAASYRPAADVAALRAAGQYRVQTPDELLAELQAEGPFAFRALHPLMGGIPPELGWESLKLIETKVLPNL